MREKIFLILIIFSIFVSGCATTTDPRNGGLFSYNPKAYEDRLADREDKISALGNEQNQEEQKSVQLEEDVNQKRIERSSIANKLADLDNDILKIEKKIRNATGKTDEEKRKLWQVDVKIKSLKKELSNLKSSDYHGTIEAKKKEYERLKQRLEIVTREAEIF